MTDENRRNDENRKRIPYPLVITIFLLRHHLRYYDVSSPNGNSSYHHYDFFWLPVRKLIFPMPKRLSASTDQRRLLVTKAMTLITFCYGWKNRTLSRSFLHVVLAKSSERLIPTATATAIQLSACGIVWNTIAALLHGMTKLHAIIFTSSFWQAPFYRSCKICIHNLKLWWNFLFLHNPSKKCLLNSVYTWHNFTTASTAVPDPCEHAGEHLFREQ